MKFEENRRYKLFGYDVVLINDPKLGKPWLKISKGGFNSRIDIAADKSFLKDMDSTEMRRLDRLFRELENYAKFDDLESQEDDE